MSEKPSNEYEGWDGRDRRAAPRAPWHLDKSFNVGHLLTTLGMVFGLVVWGMNMDRRVAVLEVERAAQMKTNEVHELADRELRQAIKEGISEVNAKLDKLIFDRRR